MFLHELLAFDQTFYEADWATSSLSLSLSLLNRSFTWSQRMVEEWNQIRWIVDLLALFVHFRLETLERGSPRYLTWPTHSQSSRDRIELNGSAHHSFIQQVHHLFQLRCLKENRFAVRRRTVMFQRHFAPDEGRLHRITGFLVLIHTR